MGKLESSEFISRLWRVKEKLPLLVCMLNYQDFFLQSLRWHLTVGQHESRLIHVDVALV